MKINTDNLTISNNSERTKEDFIKIAENFGKIPVKIGKFKLDIFVTEIWGEATSKIRKGKVTENFEVNFNLSNGWCLMMDSGKDGQVSIIMDSNQTSSTLVTTTFDENSLARIKTGIEKCIKDEFLAT